MKTLTITDAKKNLTRWLQAAANGEDVAIISGADVIALRKIEVQPADYAWTEYGLTREEIATYASRVDARIDRLKKSDKLPPPVTMEDVRSQFARAEARLSRRSRNSADRQRAAADLETRR